MNNICKKNKKNYEGKCSFHGRNFLNRDQLSEGFVIKRVIPRNRYFITRQQLQLKKKIIMTIKIT